MPSMTPHTKDHKINKSNKNFFGNKFLLKYIKNKKIIVAQVL